MCKEGSLPCPPQGPSGLKGSLEHGIVGLPGPPEAHKPLPHPLTLAHAPATALSQPRHRPSHGADHRDLRPIWPCSRSPPPALWGKSFRAVLPAGFPEPHLPCAASLPTTDSSVNYLYPSHQLLRAPGRRLSAAGLTGTAGRGLARSRYDAGRDGFIDLMELKLMMEKLGAPQTHLGLKNMIKEVDEDFDSKLSFREFLLIFRKAAAGELQEDSGLHVLARLSEIDVSTEGVKGAKSFFEAKVQAINVSSRFEEEIKAEQEERKKQAEEMKQRKAAFKELQSTFKQQGAAA
uniref:EF-hand domain family member D2 n=1 Tax=Ursus maritimus TaxID=29073 RepID=A0A452V8Y5_URSMA